MDDTRNKALSEIKKLNKKKRIVAPWQMPPLKGISFKLARDSRDKADEKLISKLQNECDNPKYYHLIKLTRIHSYDQLYILKSTLDFVYPSELIPCHYFQCATEVRFLARRCKEALLKIVNNNFLIPHYSANSSTDSIGSTFEAAIVANFCEASMVEVDRSENILQVLRRRFEKETGTLDLSNFVADKGLEEYCPLFQPRMLLYVMFLSTELGNVKTINLKDNIIKHITCMDVLKDSQVETVDLTYNQIKNIEDIKGIADAHCIKNLKLEHNPLCSNYENYNYVIDVKTLLPNLKTLDGIDVTTPLFKKNFVCSPNTQDLAQQFMAHFFTIYDSDDREDLMDFYEDDAFFSVNVHVIPFQKNTCSVRLSHYGLKHPFTVHSREEILKLLKSFPRTQHDTYTFVCDLLIFTPHCAVLTVGGIFKELNQILGFSRTFVLRYNKGSYTIANDQMTIYNATDYQLGWSFSFPLRVEYFGNPLPYYPEQYEAVGKLTQKLSKMNLEYSKMLLDYCDYDVSKAVYLFSELYKNDVLPEKAFQRQKGCRQENDADKKKTDLPFFSSVMERSLEDPSQASTKSVWNAVNTSRLQRCEDRVPSCPTNIIKIQRSTKPSSLERYSLELSCNEDDESNVAASSISHITNQTVPPSLNYINSNATVVCDTSSDSPTVIMPDVQPNLLPVTLYSKISVRSDLFSSQASDPYGISQRIQEIVNEKACTSPLSNLNDPCSISKRTEEVIVSKSLISDIYSPRFDNQKVMQALQQTESRSTPPSLRIPEHNENTSNNSNVTLPEPCAYIAIDEDDDDLPMINKNLDEVIEASASTNETDVRQSENETTSSTFVEKITHSTDSTPRQPASTSKSSSQAYSGSQLIEAIIKQKEKAAVYAGKTQESKSTSIELVDKSSDAMTQREIDKLYKKVNKNSFPWLDRNHTRRFKYLLHKNLVNRKLCDVVTDGLKRKQMCELLDEELTPTRLETLYRDGYLAKDPMVLIGSSSSVNAATYLSRVQKERLQWFLNKELISRNYHKYFSPMHIKAMTSQFLSSDRLKALFEQGYLMRDPRLVTQDNQEASITHELRDEDDSVVFPDFRDFHLKKRGRFFQKLVRYLTLRRSDRALYICGAKYLKEYIPYRQDEVMLAAQYAIHIGVPRSKVLDILDHELLFQKTSKLEKALSRSRQSTKKSSDIDSTTRKRSINRDHDQPSSKKPKLREKSSSSSSTPIDTIVLEDDGEPVSCEKDTSETSLTQKVNHIFTAEELIVVKDLKKNQKRRLQWLLDHNLLGKKYFKYLKPENLIFITKESLTMQRLWVLFTKEWLIRDPAFLFDKKGKRNVAVQRTNFSSGIYSKGPIISHSKYCQKLYNYLDMNAESRANNVSGIRDYLVEYSPYRFNEVICTVKYALANKHRWDEISAVLLKDGLIHDIADLEIKVFGFLQPITESAAANAPEFTPRVTEENPVQTQDKINSFSNTVEETSSVSILKNVSSKCYSFVEVEDVGNEESSFDPSLYIKPYFVKPRRRKLTQNEMQLIPYIEHPVFTNKWTVSTLLDKSKHLQKSSKNSKPLNKKIEYEITTTSDTTNEKIIHEKCKHLNETEKDRIRWLLCHNLLGKKCYTYFRPGDWKYLAAKTISMLRLWHLYHSKKIIRDPGFLFEKNIPLAKQKTLVHVQRCMDAVDQYCWHGLRDEFFKRLRGYLKGVQTDKVRNYMLDYAPYRYNEIVAAVKSMSLKFADFNLAEISAVLERGKLIRNAERFEHDVNELQTDTRSCSICTISECNETSALGNSFKKRKLLLTGLELEEISDEESSILTTNAPVKPVLADVDLEEISDEESSVLLREVADEKAAKHNGTENQETEVVIISDDEETVPTKSNSSLTSDAASGSVKAHVLSNIFEIRKRKRERKIAKKQRKLYMQLPVTTVSTTNNAPTVPSGMECEDLSNDESGLLLATRATSAADELDEALIDVNEENYSVMKSEIDKFFHLSKDELLNWLVDNGFLSKDYKCYFRKRINLMLSDCDTAFKLWNYFKQGLLIKDPTAMYASERYTAYFCKKAKDRLVEVNGTYIYKRNINIFIQKLETFVRNKLRHENYMKCKPVLSYLLEYIPYRRYEVLAFVKYALKEFDWTGVSFALAHIMPEKDLSQLETDVYEFFKNTSNDGNASLGVPAASVRTEIGNIEKMIEGGVNEDAVAIAKSEIVKFFHLGSKYKKFKWLIDNRFLSKNCLSYFPFAKIQSLLDCDSLFKMWSFFKEGLLIRDLTLIYASEQHADFHKRVERQLDEVDGNYIYKNEDNIFIQKLHTFVCGKLQPDCYASGMPHLKEYLIEYIPYRHYEVIAFLRHALSAFDWTEISTLLADIMHEQDLSQLETDVHRIKETEIISDKEFSLSHSIWSKPLYQNKSITVGSRQNNMQLVPYLGRPWMCESAQTINDSDVLEKLDFINRLSALKQDRLRWLLHQNLINKDFYIHIKLIKIDKLASEAFSMYTLWFYFHSGLLRINPSFLFESSFTSDQQKAMSLNLVRKKLLQQVSGHYVLKRNHFRRNLAIFLTQEINKTFKPAEHARRRAYLLEFIPCRHYETAAELKRLSWQYPLEQLRELLEKNLGVHDIVELDTRVSGLEQVGDLGNEGPSIEILNTSVESSCTISSEDACSQKADILKSSDTVGKSQNNEGDRNIEVTNDLQLVPSLPRPSEGSDPNLLDDLSKKQNGSTVQADSETADFNTIEEEEIAILRCLNEVQRDRLRWLLEKDLLSKLYYKYFSLNQLKTITCTELTYERLWHYFGFGYVKKDPNLIFKTNQSLNVQPPNLAHKDTPSGYRRGTLFRRRFHSFLRSALSDTGNENEVVQNYVAEYANHRYEEFVKLLRYWSVEYPWSKLSPILVNKLSIRNIEELERRVHGSAVIDDIGDKKESVCLKDTVDTPRLHSELQNDVDMHTKRMYDMQIVPYLFHDWKKTEQKEFFVESNDMSNKPRALKTVTPEVDTIEKQEIEVLRCLNAVQKDRLQWLVDNKLLCESYYNYFNDSELKFISNDALCLPKLWHMFFDGYLLQNPEVLFGNKVSLQLKKGFTVQYKFYKAKAHVEYRDADRIIQEVKTFLMCPELQSGRASKRGRNLGYRAYDQGLYPRTKKNSSIQFAAKTLFGQKFISYILLSIKALESDADILSRLRNYLLDYLPFRLENVTIILKHMVKKYPWSTLKDIFENSLPVYDVSCFENRFSQLPGKNITDCVNVFCSFQGLERKITNCMQVVPYVPPPWGLMENNLQELLKQKNTGIASDEDENNEFHLPNEAIIHLTELEKDRLRWLLTKKFLNVSCYSYFSADQLKYITKNPLTLYVLWFLFEYGYIARDPGFLFESNIPIERQRELACKLYDKYTTNQFRRKFGTYLGLSIKSEQTSNTTLNSHRNYVLEYVPYRYDATISYLKQYRVFTKHPWKKISSILEKDGVIQNVSDLELSIFGSKESCGKQIIDAAVQKEMEGPFSNISVGESMSKEPKFSEDSEATVDKGLPEAPVSKCSEYQKKKSRKGRKKMTQENARKKKMHKYLESLKRRMRMTTVRSSVLADSPLVQEPNEEDDIFEEFKALDSSCCTAKVSPKIEPRQTCISPLDTPETAMDDELASAEEMSSGLLSSRNTSISKCVDTTNPIRELQVTKQENLPSGKVGEIVISDSAPSAENISLVDEVIDKVSDGACNRNNTNRRTAYSVAAVRLSSTSSSPTKTVKNAHFKGSTDVSTRINIDTKSECSKSAVKKSRIDKAKKRSIVDVAGSYCENVSDTAGPAEKRSMGRLKPRMKSVRRLEDTDTDGSTDTTMVTISTAMINSPIEAVKKCRKTVKISVVKVEDSDSKDISNPPITQRSPTSEHRRKTEIKSMDRIEDADTDINTNNTVIVNVEDSESEEISNAQIEKRSESRHKTKIKSLSRVGDTDSEESTGNTFSTINTAKMSSCVEAVNKTKRNIPMVRIDDSDSENIIDTLNEKRSGISKDRRKTKLKSVSRTEDTDTDGSADNTVSGTTRANTRRGSSNGAIKGFKKIEKVLVVKIENAEKMIRNALSTKSSVNRKTIGSVKASRNMKKSSANETPTISIEDTDSEEFIVDVSTSTKRRNRKSSRSKVDTVRSNETKTDEVTTISSDSTEDTAEIIKEVESFLQSSDTKIKKDKGRLGKRERKLKISSLEPTKSRNSDQVTPSVLETVDDTVNENLDKPEQKTYTLRVRNLDELTGRVSEKRLFDEVQDQSEVVSSTKRVRMDNDYLTGVSALEMSDEVVMINGEVISFK